MCQLNCSHSSNLCNWIVRILCVFNFHIPNLDSKRSGYNALMIQNRLNWMIRIHFTTGTSCKSNMHTKFYRNIIDNNEDENDMCSACSAESYVTNWLCKYIHHTQIRYTTLKSIDVSRKHSAQSRNEPRKKRDIEQKSDESAAVAHTCMFIFAFVENITTIKPTASPKKELNNRANLENVRKKRMKNTDFQDRDRKKEAMCFDM